MDQKQNGLDQGGLFTIVAIKVNFITSVKLTNITTIQNNNDKNGEGNIEVSLLKKI